LDSQYWQAHFTRTQIRVRSNKLACFPDHKNARDVHHFTYRFEPIHKEYHLLVQEYDMPIHPSISRAVLPYAALAAVLSLSIATFSESPEAPASQPATRNADAPAEDPAQSNTPTPDFTAMSLEELMDVKVFTSAPREKMPHHSTP
jgi:hypothetical protein